MKSPKKYKGIFVTALKENNQAPLVTSTGIVNEYRLAYYQGLGASPKDDTFDRSIGVRGGHKCCGSKVYWRHKVDCPKAAKNAPDDYSDLKDI